MRGILLIAALFALALPAKELPLRGKVDVRDFLCSGYDGSGGSWELSGKHALVDGKVTRLQEVKLEVVTHGSLLATEGGGSEGEQHYEFSSALCRYYHTLGELKSDSWLQVKAGGFSVSGIGYDIYLGKSVVHIRSKVMLKLSLENEAVERLGKRMKASGEKND